MIFQNLTLLFEAGFSGRHASILINNGAIPVLSSILSPALASKQRDIVHLACKCLLKLASARLPDDCAAAAAAAVLRYPLISTLAVLVAPRFPPTESHKILKSKPSRFATEKSSATVSAAAVPAVSKAPVVSLEEETVTSIATAAVWAVVRTWFIW
jgi:hypothetical protein